MADTAAALQAEAEQAEYVRRLSGRIGAALARQVDLAGFVNGADAELEALAGAILAMLVAEYGDEVVASSSAAAEALGLAAPTAQHVQEVLASLYEATLPVLLGELVARRDALQRALAAGTGEISAAFEKAALDAIAAIVAGHAEEFASALAAELNGAAALAMGETGAGAFDAFLATLRLLGAEAPDGIDASTAFLTWFTAQDQNVCLDEEADADETPSGIPLPATASGSCLARHGLTLPVDDWRGVGLPKDVRLLCCRFRRRRCRCRMGAPAKRLPSPVDIGDAKKSGRTRADAEQLEIPVAALSASGPLVGDITETGALKPPGWVHLRIHLQQRAGEAP